MTDKSKNYPKASRDTLKLRSIARGVAYSRNDQRLYFNEPDMDRQVHKLFLEVSKLKNPLTELSKILDDLQLMQDTIRSVQDHYEAYCEETLNHEVIQESPVYFAQQL